ncbi:MAG: hypothetical protein NTZ51_10370 [Proteobacteria bacterium]|nr:hypothetical protein [Pseudomonadota bacterium]
MTAGTAVYGTVRTVVWEDGGRKPSSYPIFLSVSFTPLPGQSKLRGLALIDTAGNISYMIPCKEKW